MRIPGRFRIVGARAFSDSRLQGSPPCALRLRALSIRAAHRDHHSCVYASPEHRVSAFARNPRAALNVHSVLSPSPGRLSDARRGALVMRRRKVQGRRQPATRGYRCGKTFSRSSPENTLNSARTRARLRSNVRPRTRRLAGNPARMLLLETVTYEPALRVGRGSFSRF